MDGPTKPPDWRDLAPGWESMSDQDQADADRSWARYTPDERRDLAQRAKAWRAGLRENVEAQGFDSVADYLEFTRPDDPPPPGGKPSGGAAPDPDARAGRRASIGTRLVDMAHGRGVHLFRDRNDVCYLVDGKMLVPFAGGGVNAWLRGLLWKAEGRAVSSDSAKEASDTLEAEAKHGTNVETVYLRVAPIPDGIAIDLGTPDWTAVVVRATGWTIEDHPVRFRRPPTLGPLPIPQQGGNLNDLTALLNLRDEEQTRFVIGFLVGAMCPSGPYVILGLTGEQGSAKSFTAKLLRRLIDPVTDGNGLKGLTKNPEAFWGYAYNCWLPTFDNLSGLSPEQSDQFSQLATGAGRTARKLYTDGEQYTQDACRPAIINGLELADRPDLLSRTVMLDLPQIEGGWTVEAALLPRFTEAHPALFGALLDALVGVVSTIDTLPLTGWKTRMADHARWVTAAEEALGWEDRSYETAFAAMQESLMAASAESIVWLHPLRELLDKHDGTWTGSATDLLTAIKAEASDVHGRLPDNGYGWPKSGKGMADALKRYATSLRASRIRHRVEFSAKAGAGIHYLISDRQDSRVGGVGGVVSSYVGTNQEGEGEEEETYPVQRENTPANPATPATDTYAPGTVPSVPSVPPADDPDDSGGHGSHRGPNGHGTTEPSPTVSCRDYRAHQSSHRQVSPGKWTCDPCAAT